MSSRPIVDMPAKGKLVASDGRSVTLPDSVFEAISDIMFRHKASGTVTLHFKSGHFMEVETATRKTYK
jgi:hypothetical protein